MGAQTNYHRLILSLIRLKEELTQVKEPKLQPLINLLRTKGIEIIDYSEVIPSDKELANQLGLKIARCQALLKQLRTKLLESSNDHPIKVTEVVHDLIISRRWDEYHGKGKELIEEESKKSFVVEMHLPVTPSIGETIEIELADPNGYNRGTVYQVIHNIEGKRQTIQVFVHPYENAYYQWHKQKEEFIRWEKWREQLRREKEGY